MRYYWDALEERYGLQEFSKDADDSDSVIAIMEQVGRIRGCVVSGGRIDLEKASRAFLRELRAGKMGRFSMEALLLKKWTLHDEDHYLHLFISYIQVPKKRPLPDYRERSFFVYTNAEESWNIRRKR